MSSSSRSSSFFPSALSVSLTSTVLFGLCLRLHLARARQLIAILNLCTNRRPLPQRSSALLSCAFPLRLSSSSSSSSSLLLPSLCAQSLLLHLLLLLPCLCAYIAAGSGSMMKVRRTISAMRTPKTMWYCSDMVGGALEGTGREGQGGERGDERGRERGRERLKRRDETREESEDVRRGDEVRM